MVSSMIRNGAWCRTAPGWHFQSYQVAPCPCVASNGQVHELVHERFDERHLALLAVHRHLDDAIELLPEASSQLFCFLGRPFGLPL